LYDSILANLQGLEVRLAKAAGEDVVGLKIPVTRDDVGYLVEEVYRGKSVVSGLPLVRWRAPKMDTLRISGGKDRRAPG
jgi:hypothetical protein